jgi:hypothetical protein
MDERRGLSVTLKKNRSGLIENWCAGTGGYSERDKHP